MRSHWTSASEHVVAVFRHPRASAVDDANTSALSSNPSDRIMRFVTEIVRDKFASEPLPATQRCNAA